jgi:ParB/RepB/Spo0J family partition protein
MSRKSSGALEEIGLEKIKPSKSNPRGPNVRENDSHRENLRESIAEFGVLVPLVVRRQNGDYELVDGERRYWIARSLKLQTVPAFVISEYLDAKAVLQRMFQIHMNRDQWDAVQQCKASEEVFDDLRRKHDDNWPELITEFAKFTGDDTRTARNRVQFLRWPQTIKDEIYSDPEKHSSYWYIVEIEDKIIEPAQNNYPEYFETVAVDQVRELLYRKWEENVVKAAIDVRPASIIARSKVQERTKRRRVLKIFDNLIKNTELPYQEAYDEFARQFPDLVEPKLPRPRTLLGLIQNLTYTLAQYEPEFFQVYERKKNPTAREALDVVDGLIAAANAFRDKLKHAPAKS